jgi:CHAT domain
VGVAASGVTAQGLARMSGQFPGLLAMLPHAPDPEFGDLLLPDTWARLADADAAVVRPDPAALAHAAEVRVWLADSFAALRQDDHVLYVAGQGATPQGLRRVAGLAADGVAGSTLRLGVSVEGDGTVPWNATLAPERTWYVPAGHGDLADHVDAFDAYLELLQQGNTQALTQQPPATRGLLDSRALGPRPLLPSLPVDTAAYVLGVSQANEALRWLPPIELRVVHGSLDYARFPLMVGHYVDDGLLGAVRRVDDKLQGQLAEVLARKLFMGAERTAMYLRPGSRDGQPPAYPGAVVLGLGSVGTLTPTSLADTVTRGVLRYAFEHRHQDPWAPAEGPLLLRLSTLMLGTHVQAVSPRDSIAGVLQGVWRAQQILAADAAGQRPVRVAELELIEIEGAVALDAAYEVQRLLDRPEWRGRYHWADGTLETRAGALRGYRPGGQGSVWQRLAVREDEAGGLKFELIAERARVESTHVQAEVAAMKAYMARLCDAGATGQSPAADQHRLGQVLFRMLLPTLLKSRLGNFDRTVLVLDDKTAALPWELLTPTTEAGNDAARPLAVQAGLVRQRLTTEFRQLPTTVTGWDVLLVGNPATSGWKDEHGQKLRFNPLPGARREADRVKALLDNDARPWRTHNLPNNASFEQVRSALLDRPWRVLLLAGHGMVDLWVGHIGEGEARRPLRRTGLVLSDQHMLSAGDVEQMDPPPELVFINGCYSGIDGADQHAATDTAAAPPGSSRNLPLLASSLALQFIRMGAKAVVAAGWQVSDDDALQFAERFFQAMLQGQRFGDAVQQARTWIYRDGRPRSNTWGAYQCYGDPEWRLVDDGPRPAAWDEARSDLLRDAARCMSKWELAERIERVVGIAGDGPAGPLVRKLDDLVEALRRDPQRQRWLRSSQVRAALAEAYRELGQHPQALTWTQRGVRTAYSRLQLRHLEFAVNSLSRLRTPEGHRTAQALIDTLDQLERLLRQPVLQLLQEPPGEMAVGAHSERLCLKGSDLLRLGFQESDPHRCAQLMFDSAGCYGRGYVEKRDPEDLTDRRAYALSNAMVAAGMAALLDPARLRRKVRAGLWLAEPPPGARDAEPAAQPVRPRRRQAEPRPLPLSWDRETHLLLAELERSGPAGTFWHYTNRMDLLVGRLVLRLSLGLPLPQDDMGQVARLAETALVRCPAPVEVDSMVSRFNQVAQVLGQTPARARRTTAPLAATVQRVVQTLEDYVQRAGVRTDA